MLKKYNQYSYSDLISIIWISCCAFSLCYGLSTWINYSSALYYSLSITFGTFIIYSISNIKDLKESKLLVFYNLIAFVFGCVFFLMSNIDWSSIFILWVSFTISFFYVTPPFKFKFDVRSIPSLKIIIISLVWVISCMYVPLINAKQSIPYLLLFSLILFYIGIIIPFDIRDIRTDDQQLKTFPQIFGIEKSKRLAMTLISLSLVLILIQDLSLLFKICYGINVLYIILLIAFINQIIHNKVYFIMLDGAIFILGVSFFLS